MLTTIHPAHFQFFHKHGFIGFEGLFPEAKLVEIQAALDKKRRLRSFAKKAPFTGRDCFREEPLVEKLVCKRHLLQLLSSLLKGSPTYLAADQMFSPEQAFPIFSQKFLKIRDLCSIENLFCGLLICLSPLDPFVNVPLPELGRPKITTEEEEEKAPEYEKKEPPPFLPLQRGAVTILSPSLTFSLQSFLHAKSGEYLFVAYGEKNALYAKGKHDPYGHYLLEKGYSSGDPLRPPVHPPLKS